MLGRITRIGRERNNRGREGRRGFVAVGEIREINGEVGDGILNRMGDFLR